MIDKTIITIKLLSYLGLYAMMFKIISNSNFLNTYKASKKCFLHFFTNKVLSNIDSKLNIKCATIVLGGV